MISRQCAGGSRPNHPLDRATSRGLLPVAYCPWREGMHPGDPNERLNQINTLWSVVRQAHDDTGEKARAARRDLLARYGGAIGRYLLGAMRDEEAANDLAQDFAYRFLHGDLRGADPTRGRFRDFVKGVLFHMVADYHSKRKRDPGLLSSSAVEPGGDCSFA